MSDMGDVTAAVVETQLTVADAIYGRRSVKYFDPQAKVTEADFKILIHSAMQAATSFNIQHWRFVRITDRELRRQLRKLSYDQAKVTDASELLVITGDAKAWQKQPARYWRQADGARAPLNNGSSTQRALKHPDTRRTSQLMAIVLSKKCNAVDGSFRVRPLGLIGKSPLVVVTYRQATSMPQSYA